MTLLEIGRSGKAAIAETSSAGADLEITAETDLASVAAPLARATLVVVRIPVFSDGRAYSIARVLRSHHGYQERLRAVGDVLVDQIHLLARVGFDSFLLRDDQDPARALAALDRFRAVYQQAADARIPIWDLRRRGRAA